MKRWLLRLIAWSTRIFGWVSLLALLTYIAWNHQGIGVRGQFARLSLPREKQDALRQLIKRAGLENQPSLHTPDFSAVSFFPAPLAVLWKSPAVLHLQANEPDRPPVDVYVPFNGYGQVGGAPVELEGSASELM